MKIDQLTTGNWTADEATQAVATYYNAKVHVSESSNVLINHSDDDECGWIPADDADLDSILAVEV